MKLIVAGGRDFNNYKFLSNKLNHLLSNTKEPVTIICGCAKGADTLGEDYAEDNDLELIWMPADWDRYGKSAGYRRNEDMAKIATHCVCFWDGESKGTKHMIDLAKRYKLKLRVVKYKKKPKEIVRYIDNNTYKFIKQEGQDQEKATFERYRSDEENSYFGETTGLAGQPIRTQWHDDGRTTYHHGGPCGPMTYDENGEEC